jgi:hypothetical protein
MNTQKVNDRLCGLRDALASVRGCKRSERENEKALAIRVFNEIVAMPYDETNPSLVERRVRLLEQAQSELEL